MNVQRAAKKAVDEYWTQDSHEAREHYEIGLVPRDEIRQRNVIRFSIGKIDRTQYVRCKSFGAGPGHRSTIAAVAHDGPEVDSELVRTCSRDDCAQVAAATRDHRDDAQRWTFG